MTITIVFFLGFLAALIGVVPPGLLNMTAAKISLKEGHIRGIMFAIGACVTVFFQTYIAAIFAKYITNHPEIVEVLQRVALVIFILITIYFLFLAKKQPKQSVGLKIRSKHSRFFQGILLSALNVLPIPYQAYMTITLSSFGWLLLDKMNIVTYVSGAVMGSFAMLYMYIFFFDKIRGRTSFTSQKNMNYIIGGITGVISIITLVNVVKEL